MTRNVLLLVLTLCFAGCSKPQPNPSATSTLIPEQQTGRIKVVSFQTVGDSRGFNRDILVLRDEKTGQEYLAVMGAGVHEIRTEQAGKTPVQIDE